MKLDKVSVLKPATYHEQPARAFYLRSDGYDLESTPDGVMVTRLPDCKRRQARDEPSVVLVPWCLLSEPCSVSGAFVKPLASNNVTVGPHDECAREAHSYESPGAAQPL